MLFSKYLIFDFVEITENLEKDVKLDEEKEIKINQKSRNNYDQLHEFQTQQVEGKIDSLISSRTKINEEIK